MYRDSSVVIRLAPSQGWGVQIPPKNLKKKELCTFVTTSNIV